MSTKNIPTSPRLDKDAINALPLFHYTGPVTMITSAEACEAAVRELCQQPVLGFDTETRPSFKRGKSYLPSLVQLASPERVYLFQLDLLPFEGPLVGLFADPAVIKTGVAIQDDCHLLSKLSPFTPQSMFDLGQFARKKGVPNQGLRGLVAWFMGVRISKAEQCSNWSNKELSPRQIRYAATDAWASLAIYQRMKEEGLLE